MVRASRIGLAVATLISQAQAAEPPVQEIFVSFESTSRCGSPVAFISGVHRRLDGVKLTLKEPSVVRLSVRQGQNVVSARLLVLLEGGEELSRDVEADDCDGAVEALAFIAAVALDPGAEKPLVVRTISELPEDESPAPVPKPVTRTWHVFVAGEVDFGVAEGPLFGGGVGVSSGLSKGGWWAPGFGFKLRYGRSRTSEQELGSATFDRWVVSGDFCPSQWGDAGAFLQICARAEGGMLRAVGSATFDPQTALRGWVAAGPALSASWIFSDHLALFGQGGLVFPLIRDQFQFDSDVFHRVSPAVGEVSLGFAWKFR